VAEASRGTRGGSGNSTIDLRDFNAASDWPRTGELHPRRCLNLILATRDLTDREHSIPELNDHSCMTLLAINPRTPAGLRRWLDHQRTGGTRRHPRHSGFSESSPLPSSLQNLSVTGVAVHASSILATDRSAACNLSTQQTPPSSAFLIASPLRTGRRLSLPTSMAAE